MTSICLVAGGTGGHIFPAIAFAEWIKMNVKEVSVSFVCGARPLEREIYGESGIEPYSSAGRFSVRHRRSFKESRTRVAHCPLLSCFQGFFTAKFPRYLCAFWRLRLFYPSSGVTSASNPCSHP